MKSIDQFLKSVEQQAEKEKIIAKPQEFGEIEEIKDGVVILSGLYNVSFGEIVQFENGVKGYTADLTEDKVGVIVLGDYLSLKAGDQAVSLNYTLSIPVSDKLIGRVIDPLGNPLDELPVISSAKNYPVEKVAPGVVKRQPVNKALQTGIKSIDALIPVGRGQRELIIGDRGTGKTTVAIDTILNQAQENVICIYCGIGQKNSKIAGVVELFRKRGALNYTIVVSASASDPAASQYLAPYSATAIAEYFMDQGKDVLVVYDDLTKHAWSYRQISLILRRPAGREAYPGDIFYLHSRLLERACRLDEKYGGGSITALPIIETLEGDLSSYIPTNIISITDGQIFLETDLFNSGIRPAINVGSSVSRVGGNAQTKAMKKIAGKLKLDLAQYREMAAFSQFEGELDEETKKFLNRGARLTQILIQKKNKPYSLAMEVALIYAANSGLLDNIAIHDIAEFEVKIVIYMETNG
ncbi:MAG: F0F1 ATP synthase subunit alpha, partial [Candidatus Roizmanbacteria bacterium]|nr:F0F1 ATP synthase subunit alpha [Candidatus Roizmanbacteria bacterium]